MRQLLNTLYVNTPNAYLASEGNNVKIIIDQDCVGQLPLQNFESIVTFGYAGASSGLMQKCLNQGIALSFMQPNGQIKGRVSGKPTGNVYLRRTQFRVADDDQAKLKLARNFILGKVFNQRWVIERFIRDHGMQVDQAKLKAVSVTLKDGLDKIQRAVDMESLRGIEGNLATEYFSVINDLIINQTEAFIFHDRSRRPPLDRVNALMSFAYSLLANECGGALIANGLDPYVGFIHVDRPGREGLALDLMEELRAVIADRFVLRMINLKILRSSDFKQSPDGAVLLTDEARKKFLTKWHENEQKTLQHPYLNEKIEWGLVPFAQSQLLARCLRGDLDEYPPFLWK